MGKKIDENISMGIDVDNDGKPDFHISIKTIAGIVVGIVSLAGVWFTLQADIAEAKELPVAPPPDVTRMEFDMKDELIRQTIMDTQEDVEEIKETLQKMYERLYDLQKNR